MKQRDEYMPTTGWVILGLTVGVLGVDLALHLTGRPTISQWGWAHYDEYPILVGAIGFLLGHIMTRKVSQRLAWASVACVVAFCLFTLVGVIRGVVADRPFQPSVTKD